MCVCVYVCLEYRNWDTYANVATMTFAYKLAMQLLI